MSKDPDLLRLTLEILLSPVSSTRQLAHLPTTSPPAACTHSSLLGARLKSAAMTTLGSSSLSTSYTPPSGVLTSLASLRDPGKVSDELWNECTEACALWLLGLHPPPRASTWNGTGDGTVKGKERAKVDQDGVSTEEGLVHWFCGASGAAGCFEPATFCIRLLGMKKVGDVATWREKFERCVLLPP